MEILVYSRRLNSKYKGNLTPDVPQESGPVIGPNEIHPINLDLDPQVNTYCS